jgi:small conductance mechanosensitive channel
MPDLMNTLPKAVDPQLVQHLTAWETIATRLADVAGRLAVNLVAAAFILMFAVWVSGWASSFVQRAIGRLHRRQQVPDPTLQTFVGSMVRFGVLAVGLIAVLQQLGVQATSIIAVLTAASLAIGLALQGALSNIAAGVMILIFRPYRVGDFIESAGRQGTVKALDLLVTELATADNVKVVIPNGKVFGDVILNYSTHRRRRVDVIFKVPLKADIVGVLQRLRERVDADPRVRKDPPPLIEMMDLTEAYAQAAIRVWVARDDVSAVRTDLMLSAHLLTDDPRAELPPPRPSSASDQSAPIPGKPRFSLKAPGRGRKSGPNSPQSPPKA